MPILTILRPLPGASREALSAALRRLAPAAARPLPRPALRLLPLARRAAALALGDVSAPELVAHRYRVDTAIPKDGPCGPFGLLTLIRRRPGMDDATFTRRWFEGHSPLAMAVHPMVRYERHVVREPLPGAPPLDGVVLEHFRELRDVTDPRRFFGGRGRPLADALHVARDAAGFLDLRAIENHLVAIPGSAWGLERDPDHALSP